MVVRCAVCLVAAEERFWAKEERRVVWQRRGAINIWRCGGQGWCDYGDRAFEKDKRQRLDWTGLGHYGTRAVCVAMAVLGVCAEACDM
jgi:hypothetical protein